MNILEAEAILAQKIIHYPSDHCSRCGYGWDCQAYSQCSECKETSRYLGGWIEHEMGFSVGLAHKLIEGE